MRYRRALLRTAVAAVVAAAVGGTAVPPVSAAATGSTATTATLVRKPTGPTATGYGLDIIIGYHTNAPITTWRLEFDLPPTTAPNPWSGLPFSRTGNHWTLNWRGESPQIAGTTLTLGFAMMGTADPANCLINGNPCVYIVETDTQPPTTPTDLTATRFSGTSPWGPYASVYLTWGRSTDNLRLSGYEVSANGQVVATLNISTLYIHLAYTTQQTTYAVRAFDSVGNFSASATVVLPAL